MGYILQGAGGIVGAAGAIQEGQAQAGAARYNAQVDLANASQARQNATIAGQAGEAQAGLESLRGKAQMGDIRATQGASGIDINSGSAKDVQMSASNINRLDAMTIRSNAVKEAYGYQTQALGHEAESLLKGYEAKAAIKGSKVKAASTFLSGTGDAMSSYAMTGAGGGVF